MAVESPFCVSEWNLSRASSPPVMVVTRVESDESKNRMFSRHQLPEKDVAPWARWAYLVRMTKLAEIQDAILHLPPQERELLRHWLDETEAETPEMLAAIDEGLRSLHEKGATLFTRAELETKVRQWAGVSR